MRNGTPETRRARAGCVRPGFARSKITRLLKVFRRRGSRALGDERGVVAIMAAASLPVLVLVVGAASDYARALNAKTKMQTALDAALLATASHRMARPETTSDELSDFLRRRLKGEYERRLQKIATVDVDRITLTMDDKTLKAEVKGKIRNSFLGIIGISSFDMRVQAATQTGHARLEVALVLDVSGSMGKQGISEQTKIDELKNAAREFVRTLHDRFADADPNMIRIALVPFSQYVNVGLDKKDSYWLDLQPADPKQRTKLNEEAKIRWKGCVGSREYPFNLYDAKYTLHPIPTVMNYPRKADAPAEDPESYVREKEYYNFCPPAITPLTSAIANAPDLEKAIDGLGAGGWTYIPAGLIWGWRVLTPNAPFREAASDLDVKAQNIRRIIILMTDGANTRAPGDGTDWPHNEHQSDDAILADKYTREICDNLRKKNVVTDRTRAEVISVAFNIGYDQTRIRTLLRDCASAGMYEAKIGELKDVFKQIADQISDLYLSN